VLLLLTAEAQRTLRTASQFADLPSRFLPPSPQERPRSIHHEAAPKERQTDAADQEDAALEAWPEDLAACYINITIGLRHNEEALQKVMLLAERGLPAAYIPVALGGATAPITIAGNMAIWNAGCLVGLVLSQLVRPGAPFITTGWGGSALDMRTAISPYVEPEKSFIAQDLDQRAAERVEEILGEHRPEPLPDDVIVRLQEIVEAAERGER
jgi:trimethylamine:corrinoid methyltransferase-like protein